MARGGKAAIPGGFGTGKTVLLETLAKWCNADVIVYVGCGERGNELAGLLEEFSQLEDPRTGRPRPGIASRLGKARFWLPRYFPGPRRRAGRPAWRG